MWRNRSPAVRIRSPGLVAAIFIFALSFPLSAHAGQEAPSVVNDPELVRIFTDFVTQELANKEKYYPEPIVSFMDGLAHKNMISVWKMLSPYCPLKDYGIEAFIIHIHHQMRNVNLIDYRIVEAFKNIFLIRCQAIKTDRFWFEERARPYQFDLILQVFPSGIHLRLDGLPSSEDQAPEDLNAY